MSFRWPCVRCSPQASRTEPAPRAGPAQTLLDGKVVGNLGGFIVGTDFKASLNGESTNNSEIDFDKTFGDGSDQTRVRADAPVADHAEPSPAASSTSTTPTTRKRVIDQDLAWGDHVFTAGGEVKAKTSLKIAELAYEYAFIRQPTFEINGSLGVHYMDESVKLSGDAIVTDSSGNSTMVSGSTKRGDVSAPLPVIGLRAGWVVAPNVYLDAQGQYFKADISGYDGSVCGPARRGDVDVHTELRSWRRLQPVQPQGEVRQGKRSTAASRSATRASRCS